MSRRVQNRPVEQPGAPKRRPLLPFPVVAVLIAIVFLGVLLTLQREPAEATAVSQSDIAESAENSGARSTSARPPGDPNSPSPANNPEGMVPNATPIPTPTPPAEPEPESNAIVSHYHDQFSGYQKQLDGFKLEGVVQTNEGIELSPMDDEQTSEGEDSFRRGVVESPTIPMEHASNALGPMWKADLPNGDTSLRIEVALSVDGQEWSEWYHIEASDAEILPTFPDGSPNPNYGLTAGTIVAKGLELYPFMRYRATLSSTSAEASPVLKDVKITYLDSTEGLGYLANEPPTETPQDGRTIDPGATPHPEPPPVASTPQPESSHSAPM